MPVILNDRIVSHSFKLKDVQLYLIFTQNESDQLS